VNVGFTGTRRGMTDAQYNSVWALLCYRAPGHFHHGDCTGADEKAAHLARHAGMRIICHPPTDSRLRANVVSDETRAPRPYLDRNHDIVDETTELIATPGEFEEQLRSGTWSTVRYARRQGRRVLVVLPDGRLM